MDMEGLFFPDECLFTLDLDFKIKQVSSSVNSQLLWEEKNLIGQSILSLLDTAAQENFTQKLQALNKTQLTSRFEAKAKTRLGELRLFHWRARLEGSEISLLGRDFSEEKKLNDELRFALDRLNLSLASTGLGLWEHNFTASELTWDDRMYAIHGIRREDCQSSAEIMAFMDKVATGEDANQNRARLTDIIAKGQDLSMQYKTVWPNGEVHYIRLIGKKAKDLASGENIYFGNAWDSTAEIHTEQILQEQKAKMLASTKMAALGEMSGGIAHEINNPLTVIQARAFQLNQLADANKLEPEKVRQVADSITRTAEKIARIIKSLRTFARDGAGDPFTVVSIKQVIDETLEFCKTRFYNHGVEVTLGNIPEDLEFECRLVQIEQVLLNLLNNSFDAIQSQEEKWIRIDVEDLDDKIALHVTDSGKGIPKAVAEKMMQPFFTTKDVGKGTGLGLSISTGIIKSHHGELVYDSQNANTRLSVILPKFQTLEE